MMTQTEFESLLQRYIDGRSLPGEQRLVEQWSEQLGHEENLLLSLDQRDEVRTAMWQRIVQLTGGEGATAPAAPPAEETRVIQFPLPFWREPALRWAAAAAIVLSAGLGIWQPWKQPTEVATATAGAAEWVQQVNTTGHEQALVLADGSHVTLYANSRLKYHPGLAGQRREVYLTGQGFFKVAKNPARPFLVYTDKMVTTVLGTSFLVAAYAGQPSKVAVREGRVSVQPREGAELAATPLRPAAAGVVLLPNQQVVYAAAQPLRKELVEAPVLLTPQPLSFKKQPVAEVLAALAKAYGVNIVYDPVKLRDCTITIALGEEPLFEQLDILCKALNASYKQANNAQIIFESSGCKPTVQ